jgi:mannose-1-phosphate guanylyltransferase
VGDFLIEARAHSPELAPALAEAGGDAATFFERVTPVTVDVGVLERSSRIIVIPGSFGWDDVGTWASLARVRRQDAHGNASSGSAAIVDSARNVVHAEGADVVLYGVNDLVVVARGGLTLVTTKAHSADLKALIAQLPDRLRERE